MGVRRVRSSQLRSCLFDRLVDLQVPRASAEIAAQRFLDLVARRRRLASSRARAARKTRRTVPALRRTELGERVLERVQLRALRHPLDRVDAALGVGDSQRETGEDRRSVDEHRACPALAELAPMLGAGESEVLAQHLEQRLLRRERDFYPLAVDDRAACAFCFGIGSIRIGCPDMTQDA